MCYVCRLLSMLWCIQYHKIGADVVQREDSTVDMKSQMKVVKRYQYSSFFLLWKLPLVDSLDVSDQLYHNSTTHFATKTFQNLSLLQSYICTEEQLQPFCSSFLSFAFYLSSVVSANGILSYIHQTTPPYYSPHTYTYIPNQSSIIYSYIIYTYYCRRNT